jgi:hypothetical protein
LTAAAADLCCRHLRLQHDLLALLKHTLAYPREEAGRGWPAWSQRRQRLLNRVLAHDGKGLAAVTEQVLAAANDPVLTRTVDSLRAQEQQLLQELQALESELRRRLSRDLQAVGTRLAVHRRAGTARAAYGSAAPFRAQLSRFG